jgi:hypothetical protein
MKTISDDDLILLYYGEHDDSALARTVAADAELSRRFEALSQELGAVDSLVPPQLDSDFGAKVWQRLVPQLQDAVPSRSGWFSSWSQPRFSIAGVFSVAIIAGLAFVLGRGSYLQSESSSPVPNLASQLPTIDSQRLLTSQVANHLGEVDVILTQYVNAPETNNNRQSDTAEWATDMLITNRLYRRAAESSGNQQLAAMLADLEPLLIELAHQSNQASPATRQRLHDEVNGNLLFRVRVMNNELNNTDDPV